MGAMAGGGGEFIGKGSEYDSYQKFNTPTIKKSPKTKKYYLQRKKAASTKKKRLYSA